MSPSLSVIPSDAADPVNVLCIKWGTKYGPEYVNRLYTGVAKHLRRPFRFVCLTDRAEGIDPAVETASLPQTPFDEAAFDSRRGGETWRKVGLFQPGLADLTGDTLFLDLDIVITGEMDAFFDHAPGKFCVIQDWLEKKRAWMPGRDGRVGNTSVFRFNPAAHNRVYTRFERAAESILDRFRIEQQYVSDALSDELSFWPESWVCSFKRHCRPVFPMNHVVAPERPANMRILVFHGYPLPQQAIDGYDGGLLKKTKPAKWIEPLWKAA